MSEIDKNDLAYLFTLPGKPDQTSFDELLASSKVEDLDFIIIGRSKSEAAKLRLQRRRHDVKQNLRRFGLFLDQLKKMDEFQTEIGIEKLQLLGISLEQLNQECSLLLDLMS